MRLGGPIFLKSEEPEEIARAHRAIGYRAGFCPNVSLDDKERIKLIREAFEREDVIIAEIGAWNNLLEPDEEKRKKNVAYVCERLALADEVGALCCVNIAGSFNPEKWFGPHPENLSKRAFHLTVENVRQIVDSVKPTRARFTIEMSYFTLPDSPDQFLELVKAVDRPAFAVHIDPVNIVNSPRRYYENGLLIQECFEKLGKWIVSCHAKDVILRERAVTHIDETRPGTGALDYRIFLRELSKLPQEAPLLLEHLSSEEVIKNESRSFFF